MGWKEFALRSLARPPPVSEVICSEVVTDFEAPHTLQNPCPRFRCTTPCPAAGWSWNMIASGRRTSARTRDVSMLPRADERSSTCDGTGGHRPLDLYPVGPCHLDRCGGFAIAP